ncbi:hypothetical protein [Asaia lannensis]|uniref:Uncharacterized protein n=1 Tax=Asaia lannensis NBRC 102526 TaxID=1307926 RepID=A0ABT1CK24_9PROT|nr:hypothetical protein [Asaia lannensis]MCO6160599.1 hypothetical protein [Asaia lannensis NBRC 102526]
MYGSDGTSSQVHVDGNLNITLSDNSSIALGDYGGDYTAGSVISSTGVVTLTGIGAQGNVNPRLR